MVEQREPAIWNAYLGHLVADPALVAVTQKYVPIGLHAERFRSFSRDDDDDDGVLIEDVLDVENHIVVLGEPGAGKTWALQHLTHTIARSAAEDETKPIPIYVELRVWGARPREAAPEIELLDILAAKVAGRLPPGTSFTRDAFRQELAARSFLLIFDGLDEVRQPGDRLDLLQAIIDLVDDDDSCVIGSRRYGFGDDARALLGDVGFSVYEPQRLDLPTKRKIVRKYVGSEEDADEAMTEITRSYQHARLSDNVLLLRIMAQQYAAEHELPRTRGQLLRRYTDGCIARTPLLKPKAETARNVFMQFAETMRASQQTHLLETAQVVPIISGLAAWHAVSGSELLDALLETRIIERLEVSTHSAITFALPQYEDYFLARKALVSLENDIRSGNRTAVHANEYVANRELHHVLIVAAGLLPEKEAESLVGTLDDRSDLFLKARILGEADAPRAEHVFVDHQERKLKTAIRKALKDISRLWLLLLLLWTIAFLPLSYALDTLWRWKWWVALLVFAAHAIGIPLILQQLHRHVLSHFAARVQIIVPEVLRALSFVRTGDVRVRLRKLRSSVEEQRPGGRKRAGDDVYMSLLDRIEKEITRTIDLADRDLDTLLDEIRHNPLLIRQYLGLAAEAFVEIDIDVTAEYARTIPGGDTRTAVLCVEKLHRVAHVNARLRRNVFDALQRIVDETSDAAVATAAGDAIRELSQPVVKLIEAPPVVPLPRAVIVLILLLIALAGFGVWMVAGVPDTSKMRSALVVGLAVTIGGVLVNTISDYIRSHKRPNFMTLTLLLGVAVLLAAAAFLFS